MITGGGKGESWQDRYTTFGVWWGSWIGIADPFDPRERVRVFARHLFPPLPVRDKTRKRTLRACSRSTRRHPSLPFSRFSSDRQSIGKPVSFKAQQNPDAGTTNVFVPPVNIRVLSARFESESKASFVSRKRSVEPFAADIFRLRLSVESPLQPKFFAFYVFSHLWHGRGK